MRTLLLSLGLAICLLEQGGCAASKTSDSAVVINLQCRCDGDALCVQQAGDAKGPIACLAQRVSCTGCGCFATSSRSCWPSSGVAGLCICNGPALPEGSSLAQTP